jgi:Na+/proline symporter
VVHQYALDHDKYRVFVFDLDLTKKLTFWAGLVGGAFVSLASHGVDQMMVQRYLCTGSLSSARRALALSGWVVLLLFAFVLFVGLGLSCYFHQHPPDPPFTKNDEVFRRFLALRELLPMGTVGLMLAAVLSAAMSTLSSSLNASAGAVVADWLLPWRKWSMDSRAALLATRLLTLIFGIIQMIVAYLFRNESSVVDRVLDIAGYVTGIVLGLFFLGSFTKASERSALIALLTIVAITLPMKFLTPLAWPWYAPLSSVGLLVLGILLDRVVTSHESTTGSPSR